MLFTIRAVEFFGENIKGTLVLGDFGLVWVILFYAGFVDKAATDPIAGISDGPRHIDRILPAEPVFVRIEIFYPWWVPARW